MMDDFYRQFPPSRPRAAKSGIKAHTRRGSFAGNWWGKRWIQVLEGFGIGARLRRGRAYARDGQVLTIEFDKKGRVTATVQGSRAKPYRVKLEVSRLSDREWKKAARAFARQPVLAAKLLARELPIEVVKTFAEAGLSLFPGRLSNIKTSCSCPDWANPCKHIAAVYYLLAEELDRDPFLLFQLRGMNREQFVELIAKDVTGDDGQDTLTPKSDMAREAAGGLPQDPVSFWEWNQNLLEEAGKLEELNSSPGSAVLLHRLGRFPFWRGRNPLIKTLEPLYPLAAAYAEYLLEKRSD